METITFDAGSIRRKDENGFMHIDLCPITKEQVVHYLGLEIPGWQEKGLDPKKEYFGFRPGSEIEKGAKTFNALPIMLNHHFVSAETPAKDYQVGSMGTDAVYESPYLKNTLTITDQMGIDAIESDQFRQISAAYQFDPDFTEGEFDGQHYDFVMRNIRGNHIALVRKGRAGADVMVADGEPDILIEGENMEENGKAVDKLLAEIAMLSPEDKAKIKAVLTEATDNDDPVSEPVAVAEPVATPVVAEESAEEPVPVVVIEEPHAHAVIDPKVKEAMDACGLDSDNPEIVKAFTAGQNSNTTAMDSSEVVEKVISQIAERDALYKAVSQFIGSFAYDSMTTLDIAKKAAKELNLTVTDDLAIACVKAYVQDRPVPAAKTVAMDAAPKGESQIDNYLKG